MPEYEPQHDSGLGLIFRLNSLWEKADRRALKGDFDGWELVLDTIFRNLLYREDVETNTNENETIIEVKLSDRDCKIWSSLKKQINIAKKKRMLALKNKNGTEYYSAKKIHYDALMLYDIWVRKFMQKLSLYMRETENNPSNSLFRGFHAKKGFKK